MAFHLSASTAISAKNIMQVGEELTYEVSFLNVKLGTIKVVTESIETIDNHKVYFAKSYIDSYENIPFVSISAVYETCVDKTISFSRHFEGRTQQPDGKWDNQTIKFNYDKNKIHSTKWLEKKLLYDVELDFEKKCNDGGSLFFMARQYTNLKKTVMIPTIIEKDINDTRINFHGKIEEAEIDAIDYPVETIYFDGRTFWTGLYGLNGRFEGWFSNDDARVPILAKMNLYVGSVRIELIKWKRAGWTPPRAN